MSLVDLHKNVVLFERRICIMEHLNYFRNKNFWELNENIYIYFVLP